MRFLCSCSAVLVLVACGGGRHDPYAYDTSRPLAFHDQGVALSNARIAMHVVTYRGASGLVRGFLVVPRSAGRHPAVLFLHGSGGNREDFLAPAAQLASHGLVTMTISQPNAAASFRPLVVNARRALDVLAARSDVDPHELGLVGFSLGAQTAAILAGEERRLRALGLVAGRGVPEAIDGVRHSHADLFFQAGRHDDHVPHAQLVALIRAAPGHPRVRWYRTGHGMSRRAFDDQLTWQAAELGVG